MIPDQPVEQPHAPAGTPARIDVGWRRPERGAGDVEMRSGRLVDEALQELRRGDRSGVAPAGVLHVGEFGIDQLVVIGAERHAPYPLAGRGARLQQAGTATGERVWRMPLGPDYDKLIDSKFADVKNTGGRNAGSVTAAQFLQRFVDKTP